MAEPYTGGITPDYLPEASPELRAWAWVYGPLRTVEFSASLATTSSDKMNTALARMILLYKTWAIGRQVSLEHAIAAVQVLIGGGG